MSEHLNYTQEVREAADALMKESHSLISALLEKNPSLAYQDAKNTWLHLKLAEFELRLIKLEHPTQ